MKALLLLFAVFAVLSVVGCEKGRGYFYNDESEVASHNDPFDDAKQQAKKICQVSNKNLNPFLKKFCKKFGFGHNESEEASHNGLDYFADMKKFCAEAPITKFKNICKPFRESHHLASHGNSLTRMTRHHQESEVE